MSRTWLAEASGNWVIRSTHCLRSANDVCALSVAKCSVCYTYSVPAAASRVSSASILAIYRLLDSGSVVYPHELSVGCLLRSITIVRFTCCHRAVRDAECVVCSYICLLRSAYRLICSDCNLILCECHLPIYSCDTCRLSSATFGTSSATPILSFGALGLSSAAAVAPCVVCRIP